MWHTATCVWAHELEGLDSGTDSMMPVLPSPPTVGPWICHLLPLNISFPFNKIGVIIAIVVRRIKCFNICKVLMLNKIVPLSVYYNFSLLVYVSTSIYIYIYFIIATIKYVVNTRSLHTSF